MQVAIDNEVMVAISNLNYAMPGGMLMTWAECIKRAGVKNAMVVALDDHTKRFAEEQGVTAHEMHLQVKQCCATLGHPAWHELPMQQLVCVEEFHPPTACCSLLMTDVHRNVGSASSETRLGVYSASSCCSNLLCCSTKPNMSMRCRYLQLRRVWGRTMPSLA